MRNARARMFLTLVACHSGLYAAADHLWAAVGNDSWREFWTTVWGASLLPALWAGYRLGLPVVQPLSSAIFLPDLEPNAAGYMLCIAFWCGVYGLISHVAIPAGLKAGRFVHGRFSPLPVSAGN